MALVRWQPFPELDTLQQHMNRLFDELTATTDGGGDRAGISFVPPVEMEETDDSIHLRLEIPGMEAKDLDVRVTAESVAISGERRTESQSENGGWSRTEFRYGKFERVIPLPARVENTQAQAEYQEGILNLTLPKVEDEKEKPIKVNIG
jgi:HSP20 family protein